MKVHKEITGRNKNNTFGGYVYLSDFTTDHVGKHMSTSEYASRIMRDWKFDKFCRYNKNAKRSVSA